MADSTPAPLIESRIFLIRGHKVMLDQDLATLYEVETKALNQAVRRNRPYAFTEQGIAMLSSVLRSKRAIEVNIAIMRTFVRLRQLLATHDELAHRLEKLEWRQAEQEGRVQYVFETIQQLIEAPAEQTVKRRIGFPTSAAGGE